MIIIWKGRGLLVPFLPIFLFVIFVLGSHLLNVGKISGEAAMMIFIAILALSSAILIQLEKKNKGEGRAVIDKATGEEFILDNKDTFFFIRIKLWGIAFGVLAFLLVILTVYAQVKKGA